MTNFDKLKVFCEYLNLLPLRCMVLTILEILVRPTKELYHLWSFHAIRIIFVSVWQLIGTKILPMSVVGSICIKITCPFSGILLMTPNVFFNTLHMKIIMLKAGIFRKAFLWSNLRTNWPPYLRIPLRSKINKIFFPFPLLIRFAVSPIQTKTYPEKS